jgi:AmmeMemoRadiSam system protein B
MIKVRSNEFGVRSFISKYSELRTHNLLKEERPMNRRNRALPRGWYPVDKKECQREIESYLEGWSPPQLPSSRGLGGVVPHAGWYFSGKLATRVFYTLKLKSKAEVVVLYGGHLSTEDLPHIVTEESCETPFGDIEVHSTFVKNLMKKIDMKKESPISGDNTIEIQLAIIKYFFPEAKLVAIRSPLSLKAEILGNVVAEVAKGEKISILAIGSTDLTHYGPNYGFVKKGIGPASVEWVKKENDKGFIDQALKMDAAGLLKHALANDSACSAGAVVSAVSTCEALGVEKGILLDYYTSYDIMPDDSFVGYAGIIY